MFRIVQSLPLIFMASAALGETPDSGTGTGKSVGENLGEGVRASIKGSTGQNLTGGGSGPDNLASLLTLGLGLIAVIAIIFVCAWLVKRMNGLSGMNNKAMRIVSVMSVGARERIALIEVGGTQMVVGITPSAIRTLHVFDEPVVQDGQPGADSDFAKRLQAMIGRNWPGRRPVDRNEHEDRS